MRRPGPTRRPGPVPSASGGAGLLRAALLLVAALAAGPRPALAGAWTAEPGSSFLSIAVAPDPDGPTGLRRDRYIEHGWREGLTIGLNSNQVIDPGRPDRFEGRVEGFVRARLLRSEAGDVVSLQAEAGGGFLKSDDGADVTARLLWGRGFASRFGDAWAEASVGWRVESASYEADRALATAVLGLRPGPGWLSLVQVEADLDGERTGRAWQAARISWIAVREIGRGDSLSLQVEATPWSHAVADGVQVRLGLWRRF
ncbi:hypothetical protein P2H44_09400 [Albimonas sp. CAU 1670]|uniref:hypothetical protein n=1 Tax=Albimonas sp. CAU 1670 TaxID=3032599 RepID=UPI0023D9EE46|nr:hypothetical protein [Albimonas sp. CAU 1670]MDF2232767.1 hypothetical protein [Albimonas sp. CAU 1670]